jgi:NADPH:quinone reductase
VIGAADTMKAVAVDRFGGLDELQLREVPTPSVGPGEVLVAVHVAGVGSWDPFEREGGYAEMTGMTPSFPLVLGSEGSGEVVAVGAEVRGVEVGELVWAVGFLNPKGGFYGEYLAVDADRVAPVPPALTSLEAGVMGGVALTALRGIDDALAVRAGEAVAVVGASGGVGHVAVQLACRRGGRVLAVASGPDGRSLVGEVGAEVAVDGRSADGDAAARSFAPDGLDAALVLAGGPAAEATVAAVRPGGRVAVPSGVAPVPPVPAGVEQIPFDADPDGALVGRLQHEMVTDPLDIHVGATFDLVDAADAQAALAGHHLGKIALRVR